MAEPAAGIDKYIAWQSSSIELPVFSSAPAERAGVLSSFYVASTQECKFSITENLARLQKCLRRKAKEAVQPSSSVPDNIDEVMMVLQMRFGPPELIVRSLIAQVSQVRAVRENNLDMLVDFASSVKNMVATMKLLN